ncbi:DUF3987 domain-containing protein [Shewanella sp. S-1]|uniref:DUF3987 domain-containing protein n=1 Tax=Shewanella oncorhynchi TaxID=2726434 RepID=A0ABX1KQT9_9GAMM|nr:DUF3987 domain-containing protein [Shewanella oncorhynchi]NLQ24576.1 DUF3987 domain-containing protein [Shewanella oncorhynchi]
MSKPTLNTTKTQTTYAKKKVTTKPIKKAKKAFPTTKTTKDVVNQPTTKEMSTEPLQNSKETTALQADAKTPEYSISAFTGRVNDPTQPLAFDGLLPRMALKMVCTIAAKTESVPDFAVTALLTTLSLAIANRFRIQPDKNNTAYIITPNLSGMIIAEPGSRKSAPVRLVTEPFTNLEKAYAKSQMKNAKDDAKQLSKQKLKNLAYEKKARSLSVELVDYSSTSDEYKDIEKQLDDALEKYQEIPQKKAPKMLVVQDPTLKGLLQIAEAQSEPVLIYKDELAPFLEEVYSSKNSGFRRYLIEAMDGKNSYTNVTAHKSIQTVKPPIISLMGTTQPSVIYKLVGKIAAEKIVDDGYLDRFQLVTFPNANYVLEHSTSLEYVDEQSIGALMALVKLLYKSSKAPIKVTINDDAKKRFESYKTKLSNLQKSEKISPHVKNKLSKYPDMMLSIALVIAVLRTFEKDPSSIFTLKTLKSTDLKMASKWTQYYFKHLKKLWGSKSAKKENALKILENIKSLLDKNKCFTTRDITQRNWAGINKENDKAKAALQILVDEGVIKSVNDNKKTGRPSEKWQLIVKIVD